MKEGVSDRRVLMAMSGGIDSSVAAMLLLEQGYELVGVTFRTYDSIRESCIAKEKGCCSIESIMEAKHLAEQLGFEHHILDFRDTFRDNVIADFVSEYMHGRTPNPCVLCNSHIKWGKLMEAADAYNCAWIATGHYARIAQREEHWYLQNAIDAKKDQTYFLWMLTEENLQRTLFPLGGLTKQQVREIALQHGFERLSRKTESQEICFVPDNDYRTFLRPYIEHSETDCAALSPGNYVDAEGRVLGRHAGYCNYTIGQRKGLGIALGSPRYVTRIDAATNEVTLGEHDDLLADVLRADAVRVRDVGWLQEDAVVQARIRYKSPAVKARLDLSEWQAEDVKSRLSLHFEQPVWGITPGQSVVLYKDGLVVGGGIICC
ncbi:MAG: tRNA 2-thiouridine(34) synthase MnmA [Paludibacter sp.]|nr:tRNA 2-thiouridine(34) synthase MnmA [Bacteroidales bacterium]MCM1069010.1 tRNA 2-thiouridine(34) synthase MnmA [Prevotella sp.]MCM1353673.1 tRNA 2-thiouridine(34) synthase MnmA [Bacteroides sp.]MCM1481566.1 tRNA 2-thiouridine(34) synthase MnmA [Paludibacter sp.]